MHKGKGMKFVGDSRISAERKPQLPKDYSEYPGRTEAFWPNFLLKEWLVGAVFLVGFLTLTLAHPAPLEGVADPTNATYIPLPDWYFLFLYQLLKYQFASGPFVLFGILVFPGLAFGGLLLAPFLDKGPGRRPHQRPIAVAMMLLGVASVIFLTYESSSAVDWEERAEANKPIHPDELALDEDDPGYGIYESNCMTCHGDSLQGTQMGPSLLETEYDADTISDIAREGIGDMPADVFQGSDEELEQLVDFIVKTKDDGDGEESE